MGTMTDREKLIEVYAEAKDKNREICSIFSDCEGCAYEDVTNCHDAIIVDNLIANGVTFQQWIPVTERLPDCECIAIGYQNEMLIGWVDTDKISETGYTAESNGEILRNVAHWMPLPEPPKE